VKVRRKWDGGARGCALGMVISRLQSPPSAENCTA
jgi:hypothetical protein